MPPLAARFFENVHKKPCFLVHIVGNMHKKGATLCVTPFLAVAVI